MTDPTPHSLEEELANTFRIIRSLNPRSPDELEDYFHDAIVLALKQGYNLENWLAYLYASVKSRIARGNEAPVHLSLNDDLTQDPQDTFIGIKVDIERALHTLSPRKKQYIIEHFYEGYTLEEMGKKYHISNQAVSKVIQQGLQDMRKVLSTRRHYETGD